MWLQRLTNSESTGFLSRLETQRLVLIAVQIQRPSSGRISCCLGDSVFWSIWYFDCLNEANPYLSTSLVAQTVRCLPAMRETLVQSWVGKIPWRRKWQSTPILLPGKFHGWRGPASYSLWGHKESDITEQLHFTSPMFMEGNPLYSKSTDFTVNFISKILT